jgi:hypothetical protein
VTMTNEELLRKAGPLTSSDFTDNDSGGALGVEQMAAFLQVLAADTTLLPVVKKITNRFSKWQESVIEFGSRILRQGTQGVVGDTIKPDTRTINVSTEFLKAVVTISEEAFEDSAATDLDPATSALVIARAGYDAEDFMLNSSDGTDADLNDGASVMELQSGWLQLIDNGPGFYDATADGQDYQTILLQLLTSIDSKFKRNKKNWRYSVPVLLEEKYRDILSARGTPLGDLRLEGNDAMRYQGVDIVGTPSLFVKAGSPDTSHIMLAPNDDLYAAFQRRLSLKTETVIREGQTYYVLTMRGAPAIGVPEACAAAENVNVEV